jgi:hypothetical protein
MGLHSRAERMLAAAHLGGYGARCRREARHPQLLSEPAKKGDAELHLLLWQHARARRLGPRRQAQRARGGMAARRSPKDDDVEIHDVAGRPVGGAKITKIVLLFCGEIFPSILSHHSSVAACLPVKIIFCDHDFRPQSLRDSS